MAAGHLDVAHIELAFVGGGLQRVDLGLQVDSKEGTVKAFHLWRWPAQSGHWPRNGFKESTA